VNSQHVVERKTHDVVQELDVAFGREEREKEKEKSFWGV